MSKIIKFNTIQVLGINRTEEVSICYLLTLRKKGNNLNIISSETSKSIEEILKLIKLNNPVIILIDGKGVLNKQIDINNEIDINWKRNIDFDSIYFTEVKSGNNIFISFCRKTTIDKYIFNLQEKGIQILDFYLGPLSSIYLSHLISDSKLNSNDIVLKYENENLSGVSRETSGEHIYNVGDKVLNQYQLPLYGAAIHHFTKQTSLIKNYPEYINTSELIYRKSFELFGKLMIGFFFCALLLSYISIQYLSSENSRLNQENIYSNQTHQHIIALEQKKAQKIKILNDAGHLSGHFLNFYIYELAGSVPSALQINKMDVFPIQSDIKENKKIKIESNIILCSGATHSEESFNNWISVLKKMKWIKKFEIISLKKDKKNIQQFELKIYIINV